MKRCTACQQDKPYSAFGASSRGGYQPRCRSCTKDQRARSRHGFSRTEKAEAAAAQGGCLTCGRSEPGAKGWVVDHDRSCCPGDRSCTACRRGVLCQWCNSALGYAFDDPQTLRNLAAYLESGDRLAPPTRSTDSEG